MMNDDRENKALDVARNGLDESVEQMPDELSAKLAAMRAKAIASAETTESAESDPKVVRLKSPQARKQMVWGGAVAASCAALTLSFVLRQPGTTELPQFVAEDSLLILAEMDETEWELVQELEFALWLSEFGDEASAADFSG